MMNDGKMDRPIDPHSDAEAQEKLMARERLLNAYVDALEDGDLDAQDRLAFQAEGDNELEAAIWELHLTLGAELEAREREAAAVARAAEASLVRSLAEANLSAPVTATRSEAEALLKLQNAEDAAAEEQDPPPLTLGDVAVRVRQNIAQGLVAARDRAAAHRAATIIEKTGAQPLDETHLSRRGTRSLLARIGLSGVGAWFEKMVHDAVIDLTMMREQDVMRLAAARRSPHRSHYQEAAQQQDTPPTDANVQPDASDEEAGRS